MSGPKQAVWAIEPHTRAKHVILRRYLQAWLPIISNSSSRVVFIDGFAGPGVYEGGEEGSPVIAMRALIDHAHQKAIKSSVHFLFFEDRKDRAEQLKISIAPLESQLPGKSSATVMQGEYAALLARALDEIEANGKQLAPSLVFIDPFGVSGLPMSLVRRVLATPSCEVLINIMTGFMHRFVGSAEFEPHMDAVYGTGDWRQARQLDGSARIDFLRRLYVNELSRNDVKGRAEFVRMFSMHNKSDQPIYDLVFATNHPLGIDRMKDAMWKVDSSGGERFSDATDPQQATLLDGGETHDAGLVSMLCENFTGQSVLWPTVEDRIRRSPFRILKNSLKRAAKDSSAGFVIECLGRGIDATTRFRFT